MSEAYVGFAKLSQRASHLRPLPARHSHLHAPRQGEEGEDKGMPILRNEAIYIVGRSSGRFQVLQRKSEVAIVNASEQAFDGTTVHPSRVGDTKLYARLLIIVPIHPVRSEILAAQSNRRRMNLEHRSQDRWTSRAFICPVPW